MGKQLGRYDAAGEETRRASNLCLIDLPGFGESPEPNTAWTIGDYSDMVLEFIRENYPDTPVDFLVHSFGGRINVEDSIHKSRPIQIEKIIITGGAGIKAKTVSLLSRKAADSKTFEIAR